MKPVFLSVLICACLAAFYLIADCAQSAEGPFYDEGPQVAEWPEVKFPFHEDAGLSAGTAAVQASVQQGFSVKIPVPHRQGYQPMVFAVGPGWNYPQRHRRPDLLVTPLIRRGVTAFGIRTTALTKARWEPENGDGSDGRRPIRYYVTHVTGENAGRYIIILAVINRWNQDRNRYYTVLAEFR
ncbi:hypothetical protein CSUI_009251 [Cystoisospora suis]|uniref:Transmembrane protein n=1 Tax=Cystoisospora suis TaxID=483139 RepID=A0A2C6KHA4_9APIC|nr:hypothetical protein CSUI_009251 [Cystoisospora suis]